MKKEQFGIRTVSLSLAIVAALTSGVALAQSSSSVGASTTTLPTSPLSKIGLVLTNETSNNLDAATTQGGADTTNVVSLTYRVSDTFRMAATMQQLYKFAGTGEIQDDQKAKYLDFALSATNDYGSFLGTAKTPVKYVVTLPTSDESKAAKQAFSLGAEVALAHELTDSVGSTIKVAPTWYSRNGTADRFKNAVYGELRYTHTGKLSSYGFLSHEIKAKTEGSDALEKEVAGLGLGLSYSPLRFLDLDVNLSRNRHLVNSAANNPTLDFAFLDPKEISYAASASLRF